MIAALVAIAMPYARQAGDLVNSFETFDEIRQVSVSNAQVTTVSEHATDGSRALRVVFQPAEWPHVMLTPAAPWDWSKAGGLALDIANPGAESVTFGFRMDDDPHADGWAHSRSATGTIAAGAAERFLITVGSAPGRLGMRGTPPLPGGRNLAASGGEFDAHHVVNFQVFLHRPAAAATLVIDNVRTVAPVSMTGIVDAFGQFTRTDWPGKVHEAGDLIVRAKAEAAELARSPTLVDRDRFGGWANGPMLKAMGFFRTEKWQGKWWLVDPDGRLFFSTGVDTISADESTFITGRESMFGWLPAPGDPLGKFRTAVGFVHSGPVKSGAAFNFYGANLYRKYGPEYLARWKEVTLRRLRAWGFDTIGNWSSEALLLNARVPYVATGGIDGDFARVHSPSDYWGAMPDPFDPKFAEAAVRCLGPISQKVHGDPWCLGYFVDNELSWAGEGADGGYTIAVGALLEPMSSPARQAFVGRLRAKYSSIAKLNSAWHAAFADWPDVKMTQLLTPAERGDASAFVRTFAGQYFSVVRGVLRKLDADHLYMGCRFAWHGLEEEEAAAEFCDVVSYNIYAPKLDQPTWEHLNGLGKPCIIGEFHFGALDRGMFHPGLVATASQADRAATYESYVRSVLEHPAFVGCHWFQFVDEPLTGRTWDGENYNIGLVSVTDTPYPEMIRAAREVHEGMYKLRAKAAAR